MPENIETSLLPNANACMGLLVLAAVAAPRYGSATMLLGVGLLVAGTVFTAFAIGSAMDAKSVWLQGQQTCAGVGTVASGPANLCWCIQTG